MVDWQVTATTLFCESVDDEVTVIVYKDGSLKCVGYQKYGTAGKGKAAGNPGCDGPECARGLQYRDKLFAEEAQKVRKAEGKSS